MKPAYSVEYQLPLLSPLTETFGPLEPTRYRPASFSANSLLSGRALNEGSTGPGPLVITYAFATSDVTYGASLAGFTASLQPFESQDRDMARRVLKSIEDVCNVQFVELAPGTVAQIQFAYSDAPNQMGTIGYGFYPGAEGVGGTVWLGTTQKGAEWQFRREALILHETLHALGLTHPPANAAGDVIFNTVMSYNAVPGYQDGTMSMLPAEPMQMDVQALQLLYGPSRHHTQDDTYDLTDSRFLGKFTTIADPAGTDTVSAAGSAESVVVDLRPGSWSKVGAVIHGFGYYHENGQLQWHREAYVSTLAIAENTQLENAVGSQHADVLVGNEVANYLAGGDGDDVIAGLGGNDWLSGGEGLDTVWYPGSVQDYRLAVLGTTMGVQSLFTAEGSDTLTSIERVAFSNATLDLTVKDHALGKSHEFTQSVVSLYVGILGRIPDVQGLKYWLDSGLSMQAMADLFAASAAAEAGFTDAPASVFDSSFIGLLYENILSRFEVDPGGMRYWKDLLDTGAVSHGGLALRLIELLDVLGQNPQTAHIARAFQARTDMAWLVAGELGLTWNDPVEGQAISRQWLYDAPAGTVQIEHLQIPMIG